MDHIKKPQLIIGVIIVMIIAMLGYFLKGSGSSSKDQGARLNVMNSETGQVLEKGIVGRSNAYKKDRNTSNHRKNSTKSKPSIKGQDHQLSSNPVKRKRISSNKQALRSGKNKQALRSAQSEKDSSDEFVTLYHSADNYLGQLDQTKFENSQKTMDSICRDKRKSKSSNKGGLFARGGVITLFCSYF